MYLIILLIGTPIALTYAVGWNKTAGFLAIFVISYFGAIFAFLAGLAISAVTLNETYLKSYDLPVLLTNKFPFDHNGGFMYESSKFLLTIWLDTIWIMIHFTFTHGNPILWVAQLIVASFIIVHYVKYVRLFR